MITLTEEQFKEMIEAAHRAGQRNQGHCDPSAYEAMVYYEREVKKLIIPDVSVVHEPVASGAVCPHFNACQNGGKNEYCDLQTFNEIDCFVGQTER